MRIGRVGLGILLLALTAEAIPWSAVFKIPELKLNIRLFNNLTGKAVHHHYNCTGEDHRHEGGIEPRPLPRLSVPPPLSMPNIYRPSERQYVPQSARPREEPRAYYESAEDYNRESPYTPYTRGAFGRPQASDNPYRRNYARFDRDYE